MRSTIAALAAMLSLNVFADAYHLDWSREVGPFYIKHYTSNKYFHPKRGGSHPRDNTDIVINGGLADYCLFSFIPVADQPGFGAIKHWTSGKFLHPQGGDHQPRDKTLLEIQGGHSWAALWSINSDSKNIMHIGGKFLHPRRGSVTPNDDTQVFIYEGTHA